MSGSVEFLDLDDVVGLAVALLGDPAPIREIGLLGSAVARPQTTAFGEDAYPDIWTKAAALLHSIVKNHALVDGNKRLGWLATAVFLARIFRRAPGWSYENALRPGMIGVADINHLPRVRRAFPWFKLAV